MPWKHDGKSITVGRSWTSSEGIVHPKNWNEVFGLMMTKNHLV